MFRVFAINEPAERERLARASRNMKDPEKRQAAIEAAVLKLRPKPLHEYATPASAEQYADVLRSTPGFRDVSVKVRVLAPASKDGGKPGQRWIALHELAGVDVREQSRLRAVLDGGAFAPRNVSA